MGIQASGEIGFKIWIKGLKAADRRGDVPIKNPTGKATKRANKNPKLTRPSE
jgi:hypothetical protein